MAPGRIVPVVATGGVLVAGFFVAAAVASPSDTPNPTAASSAPTTFATGLPSGYPQHLTPITGMDDPMKFAVKQAKEHGDVQLKECPEALEFLEQPEVEQFGKDNFGHAPGPDDFVAGGCPSVEDLKAAYERARQRVANGSLP